MSANRLRRTWERLLALWRRDALDREVERLAPAAFSSIAATKQAHRDARGLLWLEQLVFDIRLAVRGLARDKLFTVAAVAMLALALGLNTVVFTVMDAMLFRGFPHVVGNERLLYLQERDAAGRGTISYADFEDWRANAQSFEDLAYVGTFQPVALRDGDGPPADMFAITVSTQTFNLLGVPPLLGRDFVAADASPGAPPVAILNHGFWERRYAKRPEVVGTAIHINGAPATIIGVMPEGFDFPMRENMWMPVVPTPDLLKRGLSPGFTVVGRLRDGVTRQQAQAEIETINRALEAAYPATNRGLMPTVASHSETMSGRDAPLIWGSLWIAACCVLLIACANLANLTLVRTLGRWREFSTKVALGAGRARLIRQLVLEGFLIGLLAGTLAWGITAWSMRQWIVATASPYQILDYRIDGGTLTYMLAMAAVSVLLMSVAPIFRIARLGSGDALTASGRGTTQDPRSKRLAALLVCSQMVLAIVLLSSAGLMVRSFVSIVRAETGVKDPERVLVGLLRLPSYSYSTVELRRRYFERIEDRLATVPGVQLASVASTIPVRGFASRTLEIEGRSTQPGAEPLVTFLAAGRGYFEVLGAAAIAGRPFDGRDDASAPPVTIVNESFAAQYWPGEEAVGKRLRTLERGGPGPWRIVVGVVPNIMQSDPLRQRFKPLVYVPFAQEATPVAAYFLLRTAEEAGQVAEAVRAEVHAVDGDAQLSTFGSLADSFAFDRDRMDAEHSELGKHATVAPVFAAIALLLAAGGLVAVMAHAVGQRTTEVAIRMAVGAAAADIGRMLVRDGMRPVVPGVIVGLAASIGIARVLRSQLVGVSPHDPVTFGAAAVLLLAVALVACYLPARRAMRVDPAIALRHQ